MQGVLRHGYQSKSGRSSADGVHRPWIAAARAAGFTLFELLIVIALIVFLAGTAAPAIRSLSRTAQINSGARQMIDHLMIARSLAISGRRVVYVIFLPGGIGTHYNSIMNWPYPDPRMRERDLVQLTNLVRSQYQAYAFFSPRTVGDQPGRPHPRYLSEWHRLPEGTIFVPDKFQDVGGLNQWFVLADSIPPEQRPLPYTAFPFPSEYSPPLRLPFVAFDPFGRLYYPTERLPRFAGEELLLTRGSVFTPQDRTGRILLQAAPSIVETEAKDGSGRVRIRIEWATGKAMSRELESTR